METTVFICGAIVMVVELVGSRILAPYLGTSIFVWTNLIGVILTSLSLGYHLGGKVADKKASYQLLSSIIFAAGCIVIASALLSSALLSVLEIGNIWLGSVVATTVLFAPQSVLLGMVSPLAVRLRLKSLDKLGTTVGNLYALSTLGSILGTFLAGYFLIAFLGSTKILFVCATILILVSLLVDYIKEYG